jgi:O-antigen/teichoic acid export membrane protein
LRGHAKDILWAYAASLARVGSWVVVYGVLFRTVGAEAAALLVLVRWTLGLLNYASAGLGPAILHYAAKSGGAAAPDPAAAHGFEVVAEPNEAEPHAAIGNPPSAIASPSAIYRAGIRLSWTGALFGAVVLWAWTLTQGRARDVAALVGLFGTGMLIDIAADAYGAVLQSRGRMRVDYRCQVLLESLWVLLAAAAILTRERFHTDWQVAVGGTYLAAAIATAALRAALARRAMPPAPPTRPATDAGPRRLYANLLSFGGLVMLAQVADFLYAPTDFQLIRWLIDLPTVAVYAPAVQVDAGILLLVGGLASALLPISAAAFGRRDYAAIRRYYAHGTLLLFALLLIVSFLAWLAAPAIFKAWLGTKMPQSRAILPWVLIPTVVGGSAGVGRSILLAIGKVRAFTAAVLTSALINVACSYAFVAHFGLGLRGIVLGTVVAVTLRCALWMPWYVLRSLRGLGPSTPLQLGQ